MADEKRGELGDNLEWVRAGLEEYWTGTSNDPLERVYVIYMFESAFDWSPSEYHLHFHLIARPQSLGRLLRPTPRDPIDAWQIARLTRRTDFLHQYVRNWDNVEDLMRWLQHAGADP